MWIKLLIVSLFFYLLGIIQTSFLVHFNLVGTVPNLIFILFAVVIFFSAFRESSLTFEDFFLSVIAGLFLDALSSTFFGLSIISFLITAFIIKQSISQLEKSSQKYPVTYFAPIFVISFIIFSLLLPLVLPSLSWVFLVEVMYNLIFALFFFYVFKKLKLYGF